MEHSRKKQVTSMAFTERRVLDAAPGEHADTDVKYLRLYVSEDGKTRTYGIYKWIAAKGHAVRKSLGSRDDLSVDEARQAAKDLYAELKKGEQPKSTDPKVSEVLAEYTRQLKRDKRAQPKWADDAFRLSYKDWLDKPMSAITKKMLQDRQAQIADDEERGPAAATRALKALRALYNFAETEELYAGKNVGKLVDLKESPPRKRVLTPEEKERVLAVLDNPESGLMPYVRPFFRLLLLTGVRWGNLAAARWDEIDLKAGLWIIPADKAKGRIELRVILRPEAVELFKGQLGQHDEWVFPSPKKSSTGHLVEPTFAWGRVQELAKLEKHATPHDLRRTFGSLLIRAGESLPIVAKALGHADPATTARHYAHVDDDAVRQALERVKG